MEKRGSDGKGKNKIKGQGMKVEKRNFYVISDKQNAGAGQQAVL
jgi:hypothetical protein